MRLVSGTKLGSYQVLDLIGSGGMGEVYRARDEKLGRDVAIKILPDSLTADETRLGRFEREARALAALSHPNILAIYDFAEEGGHVYAAMELLEGETLRERLGEGALPQRKAIEVASQIARGLAAAHDKGITHRDLKPENVFVTRDGRVKVLDFGLARTDEAQPDPEDSESAPTKAAGTEPGVVMGTVGYMSPEQVRGERADHRSDIFSFGAILYELLSGQRAFKRDTSAETMSAILNADPPARTDLSLPPALERILERCLEKRPAERFQSAHDLAFALESMTRESGPASVPAIKPFRLSRSLAAVAGVTLVAVVAYLAGRSSGTAPTSEPSVRYERLTFRRGTVHSARFDATGQNILYSAAWDGEGVELFSTLPGSRESRALDVSGADVLSVSPAGEMALLRKPGLLDWAEVGRTGTLARASLAGASREIARDVLLADWTPDGENLAIVQREGAEWSVELPIGNVLYRTARTIGAMRVSPDGEWIALGEKESGFGSSWEITFLGRQGQVSRFDTGAGGDLLDLAWSPDGREVWFNTIMGAGPDLRAMSKEGETRLLARPPIPLRILDASRDGRLLVTRANIRYGVMGVAPGETRERDFSWLDSTEVDAISADGRTLLLTEFGEGGDSDRWSVYLRKSDRSPAVRLTGGQAFALSPDGAWALTMQLGRPPKLVLVPTGAGTPVELPTPNIVNFLTASWVPNGREVLFAGVEEGKAPRYYRLSIDGGEPEAVTPEGAVAQLSGPLGARPVSPAGETLALIDGNEHIVLYPIEGGPPQIVPDVAGPLSFMRWSPDGRFLYVLRTGDVPAAVLRVDPSTGRHSVWKEIDPFDRAGLNSIYAVQIADDEETYYYTFQRLLTDLFLVEGLR